MPTITTTRPNLWENLAYYRINPVDFVRDQLNASPDVWQEEVLRDYPFQESISIVSGNGVGKTTIGAWMALHALVTCYLSKVVLTAPTSYQLYDNLWAEISKWYDQSSLGDVVCKMTTKYFIRGKEREWFMVPRSTKKKEHFQGYHAPNLFFLVDEASGVQAEIFEAIEGGRATDRATVVQISNPTRLTGAFYDSHHKLKKFWKRYQVDSEDRSRVQRVNQKYIDEMAEKYGRTSPIYQVKVRGRFPLVDELSAVSRRALEGVFERRPAGVAKISGKQIGVDPARFGTDATGIVLRLGNVLAFAEKVHGLDTVEVARVVEKIAAENKFGKDDLILVDVIGLGAGVFDHLKKFTPFNVVGINSSNPAKDPKRFHNTRTEMYFNFAAWQDNLGTTEDVVRFMDEILEDLCYARYGFDEKGRYQVEKKDLIKAKLGGRSPDLGDAVLLSCYTPQPEFFVPQVYIA